MDGLRFCQPCSVDYGKRRRQASVGAVLEGGPPVEIFRIVRVRTRNPDRPRSRERLVGLASFTDRGVCFLHLGTYLTADPALSLGFGLIGAVIGMVGETDRRKQALQDAEGAGLAGQPLAVLVHRAERVLYYPIADIRRLKFNSSGFYIRTQQGNKCFAFEGGRKFYKQIEPLADAYRTALERDSDILLSCKPLLDPANRLG